MTATMRLTSEHCAATFDPADGGRLTSFRVGDHELLVAQGNDVFHSGSFVMAPWVGRLRDARFSYGGTEYRFPKNSGPHALHGLVTDRPLQVTGDGELSIELGDPWPWPCRVLQRAELSAGRATFRLEVHAHEPMPAAVGWHLWFVRHLAGTPASSELELDVEPGLMWANDVDGLPSGTLTTPAPRPWDYCSRNITCARSRLCAGPVSSNSPLVPTSDCEDWIIYDMEAAGVCVEPWTAPPNSLNMADRRIVTPDAPLIATMTWTWR